MAIQPRISELCRQGLGSPTVSVGAIPVAIPERSGSLSNARVPFRKCQTCEVRGQSAAKPKRARVIWHNPCQACEMPAICHFGRSDAAFETSTNARHGEVSKVRSKAKGRGGTRNYADRESSSLTAAQVSNLIAATAHASAIGLPFTRMITIHWVSAGVALSEMAKATGHFTDLLTKTLARHGGTAAWLWVHESGENKGGHCHLLVHVPAELVPIVVGLQKRWLRQITGRSYKTRVIKSRPIGFLLGLEKSNPDLHATNLEVAFGYVCKGAPQDVLDAAGIVREHEPGGRIIGRRCSTSQNIGAKARKAAFSKPLR